MIYKRVYQGSRRGLYQLVVQCNKQCSDDFSSRHLYEEVKRIDIWILELHHYAKTCSGVNSRPRKAAELMVKHRAANLTYSDALTKFGKDPRMETLATVRGSLKELYVLKYLYY